MFKRSIILIVNIYFISNVFGQSSFYDNTKLEFINSSQSSYFDNNKLEFVNSGNLFQLDFGAAIASFKSTRSMKVFLDSDMNEPLGNNSFEVDHGSGTVLFKIFNNGKTCVNTSVSSYNAQLSVEGSSGVNGLFVKSNLPNAYGYGIQSYVNNNLTKALLVFNETTGKDEFLVYGNGKVFAREVTVTTSNYPDYVFQKDYKLRSLKEVEEYINTYKHLPDVKSEKAVIEQGGVNLGELQTSLLQKVEELTLYIIQQSKEIDRLNYKVSELEAKYEE